MKLLFLTAFALIVLSSFHNVDSSAYDKIVAHSRIRARKEGPNVCALQQVMGTKKKYFSTCRNWYQGTICGKKAMVLYECCPGYMKLEGMRGCPAVAPIDHVYGSLSVVKATSTQKYADISKLRPEIEGPGSFTFFAPSNEAWELLDEEVRNALVSNVNIELYNALHYHMANKRLLTKDLRNGLTVTSMYNDLNLLVNHYSNGVVTVNCARIIYGNQIATNGVVHVIDRVISAVGTTIQDTIEMDDDLTTLSDMAQNAGLLEKTGTARTLHALRPHHDAFDKLGGDVLERLQSDKEILKALLNFHLLDSVQCSEAIMAGTSYQTLEGNNIEIGCDGDSLTVNGIKMVRKKDIVTTNGVIHLIDDVLMPDSAKQVMELLESSQSIFGRHGFRAGTFCCMREDADYTLLAPLNTAFSGEFSSRCQAHPLCFHLETIGGKILRVFIYRTAVCIENSCLVRGSKEGNNGALHLMKTFLKPAEKSMFEILTQNGGFKIFLSLMEAAGLTDLLRQEGDFTLEQDLNMLKSDMNALRTILLYHINNGVFIGGGLETGVTNLLKSLQGSNLKVLSVKDRMEVNTVHVPEKDIMATNGVVHFVDSVLYPADIPVGKPTITKVTRVIQGEPTITKYTRVIESEPPLPKFTRVIQGEPTITKVTRVIESEPTITKVTRVIQGKPTITKVTISISRVIQVI
uniref:Periostin-like n=1 Tax=Gouania willdenowi TaxID=441366 RepID=A0A8C5EMT8_GOUWI